jgi:UDP-glucose 4-epimerase
MKNIAITGASGYIGGRLVSHLDGIDGVRRITGIDIRPPAVESRKLNFCRHDVREPFEKLFVDNEIDTAIHLAFVLKPVRDRASASKIDVGGLVNFLSACRQAGVRHVLYMSSHTVYGAHPDNPDSLTEDSPLRPLSGFQYSWDKAQAERILRDFDKSQPDVTVSIFRCCPVIGPNAAGSVPVLMFQPPVMLGVSGFDPLVQFLHEDDLSRLFEAFIVKKKGGIFNAAGDADLRYSHAAKLAGKKLLSLPDGLMKTLMRATWALHLQSQSPASGLEFIKYPPVISTEKLTKETGFRIQYSSGEAVQSFLTILKSGQVS